jgi:RNA polymerase sigma-70 factor (ECF subfamily)
VQEVLGAMEPGRREIFVLAEVEELSAPEISDALSVPINTVYSRLRLARGEFRDAIRRHDARDRWKL